MDKIQKIKEFILFYNKINKLAGLNEVPSPRILSRKFKFSRTTILRVLNRLDKEDFIKIEKNKKGENFYQLNNKKI